MRPQSFEAKSEDDNHLGGRGSRGGTIKCGKTPSCCVGLVIPGIKAAEWLEAPDEAEECMDDPKPDTVGKAHVRFAQFKLSFCGKIRAATSFR